MGIVVSWQKRESVGLYCLPGESNSCRKYVPKVPYASLSWFSIVYSVDHHTSSTQGRTESSQTYDDSDWRYIVILGSLSGCLFSYKYPFIPYLGFLTVIASSQLHATVLFLYYYFILPTAILQFSKMHAFKILPITSLFLIGFLERPIVTMVMALDAVTGGEPPLSAKLEITVRSASTRVAMAIGWTDIRNMIVWTHCFRRDTFPKIVMMLMAVVVCREASICGVAVSRPTVNKIMHKAIPLICVSHWFWSC